MFIIDFLKLFCFSTEAIKKCIFPLSFCIEIAELGDGWSPDGLYLEPIHLSARPGHKCQVDHKIIDITLTLKIFLQILALYILQHH